MKLKKIKFPPFEDFLMKRKHEKNLIIDHGEHRFEIGTFCISGIKGDYKWKMGHSNENVFNIYVSAIRSSDEVVYIKTEKELKEWYIKIQDEINRKFQEHMEEYYLEKEDNDDDIK